MANPARLFARLSGSAHTTDRLASSAARAVDKSASSVPGFSLDGRMGKGAALALAAAALTAAAGYGIYKWATSGSASSAAPSDDASAAPAPAAAAAAPSSAHVAATVPAPAPAPMVVAAPSTPATAAIAHVAAAALSTAAAAPAEEPNLALVDMKDVHEGRFRLEANLFVRSLNLSSLSLNDLNVFIQGKLAEGSMSLVTQERAQAILMECLSTRNADIDVLLTDLRRPVSEAEIEAYRTGLKNRIDLLHQLARELRGSSGFNGSINTAWVNYFNDYKEEVSLIAKACKLLSGQSAKLDQNEKSGLNAIHPQSPTNLRDMENTIAHFKRFVPGMDGANTDLEIMDKLDMNDPEQQALKAEFEAARLKKGKSYQAYKDLDGIYNRLVGHGKAPSHPEANFRTELAQLQQSISVAKETLEHARQPAIDFWTLIRSGIFPS